MYVDAAIFFCSEVKIQCCHCGLLLTAVVVLLTVVVRIGQQQVSSVGFLCSKWFMLACDSVVKVNTSEKHLE